MNKINLFLVSLIFAVLLLETRAGAESRRKEAEGEAEGVWEEERGKIKIAREEREIEEPRELRMKREPGKNLADKGGNKRNGREENGGGISENKGYKNSKERIKRKFNDRIGDKQRNKRDKERDRNNEKKAVDRKRRNKMKERRARARKSKPNNLKKNNENNVKKNTDEDKKKEDKGRKQNKKDKKEETEKKNKRNRNNKENKRNRNNKENKRNRNSKEKEQNRKRNSKTKKESRENKDDKGRERNRKEDKEKPEKETKGNRNDKRRERHKNKEKERGETEASEERDDEGRERSRNKENRDDEREVKDKKNGRKLKKDNGDVPTAARKADERKRKNEKKKKKKNTVDDVALRFSPFNFRLAHCMVTYKMNEEDAFLMTTDDSKQSRKCDTKFVAPKDYRLNFTCPVFNLAPTGCRREKLIVKDSNVKMTFCTNDNVDLASTGSSLNIKHKRKKTKSKECTGTYVCEVTVVKQDLASSLGEGSGGQSASVATDPTHSASTTTTPTVTTAAANQDRHFCSNCGLSQITIPRIVGGQDANRGEFPWQVGIKLGWGGRCGGSLIKHRWVITAGHCYMNGFTASTVYLGDHDRTVNEAGSYEIEAESVTVHPDFDSFTLDNDIALLKLSSPATFSPTVAPICLARPSEVPVSGKGITTGWGTTTWQGTTANILQKVAVDYISNAWCNQLYYDRYDITDNMVCTYTPKKDACQGDSGGPLISLAADGRWVLTGVVSFGDQCAKENSPGVFTRLPNYISWIEQNTPDDDC